MISIPVNDKDRSSTSPQTTKRGRMSLAGPLMLGAALLISAASAAPTKLAMIYDAGGKFDKSFNQSAYEGSQRAVKDLGVNVYDYEVEKNGNDPSRTEPKMESLADQGYDLIIGVGYNNNANITAAAKAKPNTSFGLIDDISENTNNVASILFKEEEGSYLAGYIAASQSSTGVIGFVGGLPVELIYRFAAGFKAGAKAARPDVKIFSEYVGTTPAAWDQPDIAYAKAAKLAARGADIIFAAAGNSGQGVIRYVNTMQCLHAKQLPANVSFNTDLFSTVKKSAAYTAKCGAGTRPLFFIGVDSNQNYLGDDDKNPATLNHGLTSMTKRVDNAVYAVTRTVQAGTFKGGTLRFGLKEGGVGYALDEYNRALISTGLIREVEKVKNKIVRQVVSVPTR